MSEQRIKQLDEKFCPDCGEIIKIKAEICPKCGVRQLPPPECEIISDPFATGSSSYVEKPVELASLLFSFEGRVKRLRYFLTILAIMAVNMVGVFVVIMIIGGGAALISAGGGTTAEAGAFGLLAGLGMMMVPALIWFGVNIWIGIALEIKRIRDIGLHWAFWFILFIPFIGGVFALLLFFLPSKDTKFNAHCK